jgi:hypothetical protein
MLDSTVAVYWKLVRKERGESLTGADPRKEADGTG